MRVDLFDYELPPERIAQYAIEPRDNARLFVYDRKTRARQHRQFRDLIEYLHPGDTLVVNNTRVLPARVYGQRQKTGGKWEGLFLEAAPEGWRLMTKTRGRPSTGEVINVTGAEWTLTLGPQNPDGTWWATPSVTGSPADLLTAVGHIPLPPYIRGGRDKPEDAARYQTVYAQTPGAVAAPTAGLHFTSEVLEQIKAKNVAVEAVTLHVGPGTFLPVTASDTAEHHMHFEWCELPAPVADRLVQTRAAGHRIIAVGTTVVRTLEAAFQANGKIAPFAGSTNLFITPPHNFQSVDALITNFHLPKSTLLMLVAAFAGREETLSLYREAVHEKYRFYSYGDAMLFL